MSGVHGVHVQHHVAAAPAHLRENVSLQLGSVRETEQIKKKHATHKSVQVIPLDSILALQFEFCLSQIYFDLCGLLLYFVVDCKWGKWAAWGSCSATCGKATHTR